jgi:hypothetical protein
MFYVRSTIRDGLNMRSIFDEYAVNRAVERKTQSIRSFFKIRMSLGRAALRRINVCSMETVLIS